ncbi:MAG TPA: magnesium-translocating P-type ATPase [Roseomonas sp.]|nr:magnesium-translocating P-type ATPase [Roseomonas sp.]
MKMAKPHPPAAGTFWTEPEGNLLNRLSASPKGLSSAQARRRLAIHGLNTTVSTLHHSLARRIMLRAAEPLIAILLIAAAVSGLTGDIPGFLVVLGIVVFSVTLDVIQEGRATAAAQALQQAVALKATVLRDGKPVLLPVEEIVPGDVVQLGPGNLVPADGIMLSGTLAQVNEAILTGEPYPVNKGPSSTVGADVAKAASGLFAGTAMISGNAAMLVVLTGAATRLGAISGAVAARRPAPAFERGLRSLSLLILRLTAFLALFILLAHLAFHRPPLESFLFAVALAVGLTPELLPMVTTVTLSRGALRMAKRKVIVKRLAAIHDLGAMDVLCTDKTGTLTEARIAMVGTLGADGTAAPRALEMALVNAGFSSGPASTLDAAILAAASGGAAAGWQRLGELPFDFERRRSSVIALSPEGRRLLVVKGAPESVLGHCSAREGGTFDAAALHAVLTRPEAEGLRLLAVAWRELEPGEEVSSPEAERNLTYAGACLFSDPPKSSASGAVARLAVLGVRVKILSGDAAPVLRHVAITLGMPAGSVLTGEEIARMSDAVLAAQVQRVDLFARLAPEQKRRVVLALKNVGHSVGFLGDGINDAPAIRAADAGVSVEDATEVARAAADLILLEPDLGVLTEGVEEGRRTYANVMKYVRMGTSSNFGNMLSVAIASLAIPFLPLLPAQILLNNLLYDLSELGIPFDRVDEEDLAKPHGWHMREVLRFMLVLGPLSSLFDLGAFVMLRWAGAAPAEFRTAWFLESMATQILVIFFIRSSRPVWKVAPPHPVLLATSLGTLAAAVFLALGPLAPLLGFAPVPAPLLAAMGALGCCYLAAAEGIKRLAAP